jgi:hypothetical protein
VDGDIRPALTTAAERYQALLTEAESGVVLGSSGMCLEVAPEGGLVLRGKC